MGAIRQLQKRTMKFRIVFIVSVAVRSVCQIRRVQINECGWPMQILF